MKIFAGRLVLMFISFAVLALASGNISHAIIDPGAIELLFLFNEGQGDMAMDSSGNHRHGTPRRSWR